MSAGIEVAANDDQGLQCVCRRILTMSGHMQSSSVIAVLLLAMTPALTACTFDAAISPSAATPSPEVGCLRGQVVIGPTCPAERSDSECPDDPFAAELIVQTEDGEEVTRISTGDDGQFQVELAPGDYVLVPVEPNQGAPPNAKPSDFSVELDDCTELRIRYDSGIRGPGSSKQEP